MYCSIDLRYGIPPLMCLILLLFQNSESTPWNLDGALETDHHYTSYLPMLLLAVAMLLIFLFTSIKLPVSVSIATEPIRLRAGDFSSAVVISLVASFILPPPLFWVAYLLIICISPWYGFLLNLFKHYFCWLCHTLQAIPTFFIFCITQQHESPEPEPARVEIDVLDAEGDQSSLEGVVIDEQLQE